MHPAPTLSHAEAKLINTSLSPPQSGVGVRVPWNSKQQLIEKCGELRSRHEA